MKKLAALTFSLFLSVGMALADSPKDSPKDTPKDTPKEADAQPSKNSAPAKPAPAKTNAEISAEMEQLRQAIEAQQQELQLLKEELAKRDRQIEEAREAAAAANSRASEANLKATEAAATSAEVKTSESQLNASVANLAASSSAAASAGSASADSSSAGSNSSGATPMNTAAQEDQGKGPLTIRFKGVSITPGGFLAAETVNRQHALSDDINTQFNAIPFSGNDIGHLSELSMTARQSRITLLVTGQVKDVKLTGYYETDWLGTGVTSNNRQSNSYVNRMRQLWGQAKANNGWSFTGGQMWSLATQYKKGLDNLQEWIPATIDPQYQVGFTWLREYGARVVKNFGNTVSVGLAAEAPQVTVGGRGFSTYTNTSATGVATTYQNSFLFAPGAGGGLLNFSDTTGYALNLTPDFIAKIALDPGYGHYELYGVVSTYQNRIYPCAVLGTTAGNFPTPTTPTVLSCTESTSLKPSAAGAYNNNATGGAIGANALLPVTHKLDAGLEVFYGDGENRYGSAQLPDATLRPDGTIALVHGAHWLGRLELHPTPKLDIYGYVGGEYAARTAYVGYQTVKITNTPAIPGCGAVGQQPCPSGGIQPSYPALTTTSISLDGIGGYGSPFSNNTGCSTENPPSATGTPGTGGTCAGDTRYISEGTLGFWYKFYQGEKGRVQFGIQYSYIYRNTWSGSGGLTTGAPGISPHATDNMWWTSFRYYLP
jgi:hypothetical protein